MIKLDDFLEGLSDSELAIFVKYRFDEFLKNSQKKIILELKKRNLNEDKIISLFKEGLANVNNETQNCPRCNSTKFYKEADNQLIMRGEGGYEISVDTYRCELCGFNPGKDKPMTFMEWLKKRLGFYSYKRLK